MVVYLIYASFPTPIYQYLFMKDYHYSCHIAERFSYSANTDKWYGLYAYTSSKQHYQRFMRLHKSEFFHGKKKHLKDREGLLLSQMLEEKLYETRKRGAQCSLLLTGDEETILENYVSEKITALAEKSYEEPGYFPPYHIFRPKYLEALENTFYTTTFAAYLSTEYHGPTYGTWDDDTGCNEVMEVACDGMTYGLSYPSGKSLLMSNDMLEIYVRVFAPILSSE